MQATPTTQHIILSTVSMQDYADDVAHFFNQFSSKPALIGPPRVASPGAQTGAVLQLEPPLTRHRAPGADHPRLLAHPAVRELFKRTDHLHPAVLQWLSHNCPMTALEAERRARSASALHILDRKLSTGWPAWMTDALQSGAGPVWAPVLRGSDASVHRQAIVTLADRWHIQAAVRMFNWTGNPISPFFEPALALPIHGAVQLSSAVLGSLLDRA